MSQLINIQKNRQGTNRLSTNEVASTNLPSFSAEKNYGMTM